MTDDLISRLRADAADLRRTSKGGMEYQARQFERAADALKVAQEDKVRLDWLERMADLGIRLHNGDFSSNKHVGLGLANTGRTLRQAIDAAREARNG